MSIELVGLAYDQVSVDQVWSAFSLRDAYEHIASDDFRRKVDLRSLLYHKGQLDLLSEIERMMKQSPDHWSITELMARRFHAGTEDFPSPSGEFAFDFKLIRHFSSLAMVDDFLVAEPFLRLLLRKVGFLKNGAAWSLLEVDDFNAVATALREVRMQDILDASRGIESQDAVSFENLVRNYIEFLGYSKNNRLTPFFYNSESDFKRWGNLAERRNARSERVVDLSMQKPSRKKPAGKKEVSRKTGPENIRDRLKIKKESDALLTGLRDSDPIIRQKAAESLAMFAGTDTLPELLKSLSDPEPEVRQELVRAVGQTGDASAVEALIQLAEMDEAESVQWTAAVVLQEKGTREILPVLIDAVEKGKPGYSILLAYHRGLPADKVSLGRLKALCYSDDAPVRREVAYVWGRVPTADSLPSLELLVKDSDDEVRSNALYSMLNSKALNCSLWAKKLASESAGPSALAGNIVLRWLEDEKTKPRA